MENIALLGATQGMGLALARAFAARGDRVFLLGHDPRELSATQADLLARHPGSCTGTAPCDLRKPDTFGPALQAAHVQLGGLDAVIVTAAVFATQEELEASAERTQDLLSVDFTNTIVFAEHARKLLLATPGKKQLVVFSSVAGERGRKPVGIYGAAKAGLSTYLESLDHKYHAQGLRVLTVKPGFVKTGMTAGLKPPPFAGEPEQVASDVLLAMRMGWPVLYTPLVWAPIMTAIRALPRFVMRKINF